MYGKALHLPKRPALCPEMLKERRKEQNISCFLAKCQSFWVCVVVFSEDVWEGFASSQTVRPVSRNAERTTKRAEHLVLPCQVPILFEFSGSFEGSLTARAFSCGAVRGGGQQKTERVRCLGLQYLGSRPRLRTPALRNGYAVLALTLLLLLLVVVGCCCCAQIRRCTVRARVGSASFDMLCRRHLHTKVPAMPVLKSSDHRMSISKAFTQSPRSLDTQSLNAETHPAESRLQGHRRHRRGQSYPGCVQGLS